MSKLIYTLYKTERIETGEYYIGIHKIDTEKYPNFNDGYLGSGNRIRSSVKKYGKKAFKRIILSISEDLDVIVKLEKETVNQTLLNDPLCLNLALGGAGEFTGRKHSEETRKKMSESHKGNKYALGAVRSEEFRKNVSETLKGNKYALGAVRSEELKKKLSEANKGKPSKLKGIPRTEETKKKISEGNKGTKSSSGMIWINNGKERKLIDPEQLNDFISKGFQLGKRLASLNQ